ncbi:MAG TPA: large conductance mechanosensitive channel protein MscL [Bacilli bacterium]|nr:large conductance mechanosensitive channel protein MscL [Bacilli bacterium]
MKKFWSDFKAFISRGNVLDMAVGVIIGAAFKAIVSSFVTDIITPLISLLVKADVTDWSVTLRPAVTHLEGAEVIIDKAAVVLTYGIFIQSIIDFLMIAFVLFVIIKVATASANKRAELIAKINKKKQAGETLNEEEIKVDAATVPQDVILLQEIRDLLKEKADGESASSKDQSKAE